MIFDGCVTKLNIPQREKENRIQESKKWIHYLVYTPSVFIYIVKSTVKCRTEYISKCNVEF